MVIKVNSENFETEVLNSEEVKEFINEKYSGSIVPAF